MIFAVETETRSLSTFETADAAIAACEGLDVEAAIWLFWADDGAPLEPVFTTQNKRGFFSVTNGVYYLAPAQGEHHAHLSEAIDDILTFECAPRLGNASEVKAYLATAKARRHGEQS